MKRFFRTAAALAALLAVCACTNSGMNAEDLRPLRAEQAASANPPPPPRSFTQPAGAEQPAGAQPTDPASLASATQPGQMPAQMPGQVPGQAGSPLPAAVAAVPAPSAPTAPAPTAAPAVVAAPAATPAAPARPRAVAAGTPARIQFAPVVGASPTSMSPLAARLTARAAQRGIGVAPEGDSATHVLKGYFSSFTEQRETTVIYVWDVLDPAGNRLHRIQGQQKVSGAQGEGWNSVTAQVMETIADRTIDDLATWLVSRAG